MPVENILFSHEKIIYMKNTSEQIEYNNYTWKESSIAFSVFCDEGHCLSFALTTNKTTVFPFAVAFARL